MSPPRAWVLNLDAEEELDGGKRYQPTTRVRAIVARERMRLYGALVAPGDLVLDPDDPDRADVVTGSGTARPASLVEIEHARRASATEGLAWSPTPRALARLASAGAQIASVPSSEVLRSVNARPFATAVRTTLASASFEKHVVLDLEGALALLARPTPHGWLVRRTFGAAGRGRRRIASGRVDEPERLWLLASLRRGPLVLEPWVEIVGEHTRSAFVARDGTLSISPPCFQETRSGAWTRTELAPPGDLARAVDSALLDAVERAGAALAGAGYFGPFGIDAFQHRALDGRGVVLNPLSEINARFTMDWAEAMGATRMEAARSVSPS